MNVPQTLNLVNQTFNSQFLEFVWQFPYTDDEQDQFILKVYKTGDVYIEGGRINAGGDYRLSYDRPDYSADNVNAEWLKNVPDDHLICYAKRFFTLDEDLVNLVNECVSFLNNL